MSEHKNLIDAIRELTGIHLSDDKAYLLETRLKDTMKKNGIESYDEVARKLRDGSNPELREKVVDQISTHETRFFRDESIFTALPEQIIPEWFEKRGVTPADLKGNILNIWSAACSNGQEPYSIAMAVAERYPALLPNLRIYATDISEDSINRAQDGLYSKFEVDRGVPPFILKKYFDEIDGKYRIKDLIRRSIRFERHNLVRDEYPNGFDMILCRNVIIYFEEKTRNEVIRKIQASLKTDGVLILGSSENLIGSSTNYIVREFGLARYYEFSSQVTFFGR